MEPSETVVLEQGCADNATAKRLALALERLVAVAIGPAALHAGMDAPDLDIDVLGIGSHRSPLFHSAALPYVLARAVKWGSSALAPTHPTAARWLRRIGGTAVGLGSLAFGAHLLLDVIQPKAVLFPLIGSLVTGTLLDDRAWLLLNGIASLGIGLRTLREAWQPDDVEVPCHG